MLTVLDDRGSLYFVGAPKAALEIWREHPNFTVRQSLLAQKKAYGGK